MFIISLILVVLGSTATIVIFLVLDHVKEEVVEELDATFQLQQSLLHLENRELLKNSQLLSKQLGAMITKRKNETASIREFIKESRIINDSDLMLLSIDLSKQEQIIGESSRAVLTSQRVLSLSEYEKVFAYVRSSGESAKAYLFIDDVVLNAVAVPVWTNKDEMGAVLLQANIISDQALAQLKNIYRQEIEIMLFASNAVFSNTNANFSYQAEMLANNNVEDKLRTIEVSNINYYSKTYPLADSLNSKPRLFIMLSTSSAEQLDTYSKLFQNTVYAAVFVILLAALAGINISRSSLSRPIKDLAEVSHAIGEGNLDVDIKHQWRKDELGELAVSFDQMRNGIANALHTESLVQDRISDFAEVSSDWLWETDADGVFTYLSASVSESLGYNVEQMLGKRITDIFINDNLIEFAILFSSEVTSHVGFKNLEIWLTTKSGYRICVRFNARPYFIDGEFQGYRGTASDITKSKNDEERLTRLANKDHLTGLPNRARFMEELDREIRLAERQYTKGALLLIDLDHFKLINDTAGHAAGDEVIVQFAGLLKRLARNVDLVARLSGDEFVIAFVNTDIEQLDKRINDIVKKINQLKPMYSGKVMNTTASVGVAIFPDHANDPVELLAKADTAMYMAKKEGRNRARMYEPGDMQQEKMGSQLTWKDRIHDALEHEKLVLAYQPIKPTTGEPASRYEVLVRMLSNEEGQHFYPGDFIPTAEQFGLIREIDTWVVKKAIGVLAGLPKEYFHISFTVNLSGLSVGEQDMLNLIEAELLRTGIDRSRLIFEVTESAAFQDIGRAIEFIDSIKVLGCRIALDDFGVGFSSFSYLKQLQADILKIDGSFIRDIHRSKDDQLFVKALVDVARGMGMMTVAEFVESEEVYDVVREIGVDYVQGYYIGKPSIGKFV